MTALSQGDNNVDDRSREGAVEGATALMTLLNQLSAPNNHALSQGDNNATAQLTEGCGGE